jgi:hypothetical protein
LCFVIERPSFVLPITSECHLQAGNLTDTGASFHTCTVELGGVHTLIIATATEAGIVSLWDGKTGSYIVLLDEPYGTLNLKVLRICAAPCKPCTRYGVPLSKSFALILTAGFIVHIFRIFLPPYNPPPSATSSSRRTCLHNSSTPDVSLWTSSLKHHPQCHNSAPTTLVRPVHSRDVSVSEDSALFPVSGHGVLSRRASEKDSLHHIAATDTRIVSENASNAPLGPSDPPRIPTRWRSLVISQIADTTCECGAWDVAGSRAVGLRRRLRKPPDSGTNRTVIMDAVSLSALAQRNCGLSAASLEHWEVWMFNPAEASVSASPLAALETAALPAIAARPAVTRETSRLPFMRVCPLVSGRTYFLAGFGNIVGLLISTNKEVT